jgi:hypothetical protein
MKDRSRRRKFAESEKLFKNSEFCPRGHTKGTNIKTKKYNSAFFVFFVFFVGRKHFSNSFLENLKNRVLIYQ